jgi:hypothetical protein
MTAPGWPTGPRNGFCFSLITPEMHIKKLMGWILEVSLQNANDCFAMCS